jgi:hypothetical protein
MMQKKMKTEKGAKRSGQKPESSRLGVRRFATLETEQQSQGGLCGPFCGVNLMDLPLHAKTEPNRTGMPDQLKAGIESLSGVDISDVRVHANSDKPAQLNALAYAQGSDIHLAPGREQHLPHEAWHVVQQRQGRVMATLQAKEVGINDDPGLEHEADLMGKKATGGTYERILQQNREINLPASIAHGLVQRMCDFCGNEDCDNGSICHGNLGQSHSRTTPSGKKFSHAGGGKGREINPRKSASKDRRRHDHIAEEIANSKARREEEAKKKEMKEKK